MRDLLLILIVSAGLVAGLLGINAALRAGSVEAGHFRLAAFD
ncbi:hypothetical protein [Plastoroseomonas hellenica]|nr:hypothetical protein [Plastoroseomonas hellenica]